MGSRIEDLRDLARMLDEGKISQREYDIVKADLLRASSEEWLSETAPPRADAAAGSSEGDDLPGGEGDEGAEPAGWLRMILEVPATYRIAMVGAVLVLVLGGFISTRSDATGTIAVAPRSQATTPTTPPEGFLGIALDDLAEGWNAVEHPPRISGGITSSPEPGPLDSFLYRFNDSALIAGAYDTSSGYVSALMVSSSLHYEASSNIYIHLCYLLDPGSQACLETFVEETGLFGKSRIDLIGTEHVAGWAFDGKTWSFEIADDVETIRVKPGGSGN